MNNTVVHFVSQTYQALKALKVALMTLIHSIKTGKKDTTLNNTRISLRIVSRVHSVNTFKRQLKTGFFSL